MNSRALKMLLGLENATVHGPSLQLLNPKNCDLKCDFSNPLNKMLSTYSGGHLRFYGKNVSFCPSPTNDITETNKVPLKSPIKMLPEMQKKIWIFQKFLVFRAFFEKAVFLENGLGGHETVATSIHYVFIFSESQ